MYFGLSLGLMAGSILFFFAFFLSGQLTYKKKFSLTYDIRNTFPYEINYQTKFLDNILVNSFLIFAIALSLGYFIFFNIGNLSGINIVIVIAGCALSVCVFFLFFADLKYLRFHLFLMIFVGILAFALPASIAISAFGQFQADNKNIFALVMTIISAIFALFIFGVMMNPKLNFKLEMKKQVTPDGKEVLVRPKYFVLAFSEWIFIFSLFVSQILLLIINLPL